MNTRPASLRAVFQRFIPTVVLFLFVCSASGAEQPRRSFDVPAGDAAATLRQFASQAAQQVAFPAEVVRGIKTNRVKGEFTAREALDQMTAGTRLVAVEDADSGALSVRRERSLAEAEKNGASRPASDRAAGEDESKEAVLKLPAFTVTGDKTINADIPRTRDDPQPYVVFDRNAIEQASVSSLEDFFKTRLPMNSMQRTNGQFNESASLGQGSERGNQSSVNLRGLGVNQTLILVDGRRMPGVNIGGGTASAGGAAGFSQPDINGIPLSMVERIEVLPSTASGIYGGGATGGVINIITRKDYTGAELQVSYSNAFDTDVAERSVDFTAGMVLRGGRTHLRFSASHKDSNALLVGDRNFALRSRELNVANNPGFYFNSSPPPFGYTSNIRSLNGANLVLKNGTALNSPITFVPVGYAGPLSDGGAALVANAGRYNVDLPDTLLGARQSILNNPTIESATISLRQSVGAKISTFLDVNWLSNRGKTFAAIVPILTALQPTAANNPFNAAIFVSFPATDLNYPLISETNTRRVTGGGTVQLPGEWTATLEHVWSRVRYHYSYTNPAVGDLDGSGPLLGFYTAIGNGTLDIMRDLNRFPLDYAPFLFSSPNRIFGPADTILNDTTLRFAGPLLELPAGKIIVSSLIERRKEEASDVFVDDVSPNNVYSAILTSGRWQSVDSYYLEANLPVIGSKSSTSLARSLDIQASVRHDRYETEAPTPSAVTLASRDSIVGPLTYNTTRTNATKFTVGLRYSPTEDLAMRVSFGTGFLPPSVHQIAPVPPVLNSPTGGIIDPKRGSTASVVTINRITGGNPALKAEESESWSSGIVFTPRFIRGLRLSVDYTVLEKTNEISNLNFNNILLIEDALPGRVLRDPLLPADQALGYTGGVLRQIDGSLINYALAELEAWDFQVDYAIAHTALGEGNLYALATYTPTLTRIVLPGLPVTESAGYNNGPLKWRGNLGFTWKRGPWTLGWNTQYYDSYFVYSLNQPAAGITTSILNQGSDKIPSQTYHDLSLRYRFEATPPKLRWLLANTDVTIGIQNLFDKEPPIVAGIGTSTGYSFYGDPRLRRYSITVRRNF